MSHYYEQFRTNLNNFISSLFRYTGNEGVKKFLDSFDRLNMDLVIERFVKIMKPLENDVKMRNEDIFSKPVNIFPGIDLSKCWTLLQDKQKIKVWTYLKVLTVLTDLIIQESMKMSVQSLSAKTETKTETETETEIGIGTKDHDVTTNPENGSTTLSFNPYQGLPSVQGNYTVDQMFAGELPPDEQTSSTGGLGLGSLAKMAGLDKMINMEEFSEQLKNMTPEQMEETTQKLQEILGDEMDEQSKESIKNLFKTTIDELKETDMSSGNAFENVQKLVQGIASKTTALKNINPEKILKSTELLANQCRDENGEPIFQAGANPLTMLRGLLGQMGSSQSGQPGQPGQSGQLGQPGQPGQSGQLGQPGQPGQPDQSGQPGQSGQQINPQQCINQCNAMFKQMGIDPNNLNLPGFSAMLSNMQLPPELLQNMQNIDPLQISESPNTSVNHPNTNNTTNVQSEPVKSKRAKKSRKKSKQKYGRRR